MKSTKTKIQCKPCKTFITEKSYSNHLKSFTHIQKILPKIIITTPERKVQFTISEQTQFLNAIKLVQYAQCLFTVHFMVQTFVKEIYVIHAQIFHKFPLKKWNQQYYTNFLSKNAHNTFGNCN